MKKTIAMTVALVGLCVVGRAATIPEDVNVGTQENPGNVTIRGRNSPDPILNIRVPGTGASKVAVTAEGRVGFGVTTPETVLHIKEENPVVTLQGAVNNATSSIDMLEYANTGIRLFYDGAAGLSQGGRFEVRNKSNNVALMTLDRAGIAAIGLGVSALGNGGQVVLGKYNDTRTNDDDGVDHTKGLLVVGSGASASSRANALRITESGVVLINPAGDINAGEFTHGPTP